MGTRNWEPTVAIFFRHRALLAVPQNDPRNGSWFLSDPCFRHVLIIRPWLCFFNQPYHITFRWLYLFWDSSTYFHPWMNTDPLWPMMKSSTCRHSKAVTAIPSSDAANFYGLKHEMQRPGISVPHFKMIGGTILTIRFSAFSDHLQPFNLILRSSDAAPIFNLFVSLSLDSQLFQAAVRRYAGSIFTNEMSYGGIGVSFLGMLKAWRPMVTK